MIDGLIFIYNNINIIFIILHCLNECKFPRSCGCNTSLNHPPFLVAGLSNHKIGLNLALPLVTMVREGYRSICYRSILTAPSGVGLKMQVPLPVWHIKSAFVRVFAFPLGLAITRFIFRFKFTVQLRNLCQSKELACKTENRRQNALTIGNRAVKECFSEKLMEKFPALDQCIHMHHQLQEVKKKTPAAQWQTSSVANLKRPHTHTKSHVTY